MIFAAALVLSGCGALPWDAQVISDRIQVAHRIFNGLTPAAESADMTRTFVSALSYSCACSPSAVRAMAVVAHGWRELVRRPERAYSLGEHPTTRLKAVLKALSES